MKTEYILLVVLNIVNITFGDAFVKTLPLTGASSYGPVSSIDDDSFGTIMGGTTGSIAASEGIIHHTAAISGTSDPFAGGIGYSQISLVVFDGIRSDIITVDKSGPYKLILKLKVSGNIIEGQLPISGYSLHGLLPGVGKTTGFLEVGCNLGGDKNPESVKRLHNPSLSNVDFVKDVLSAEIKALLSK